MTSPSAHHDPLGLMVTNLATDQGLRLFKTPGLEVITPKVEIIGVVPSGEDIMRHLEAAIRTAYKSEGKVGPGSHVKILKHIMGLNHESTLEHFQMTFRVITNRGVSHEIVRSRIGHSYTQESTRYVGYDKHRPQVILPWHLMERPDEEKRFWMKEIRRPILGSYLKAMKMGWKAQDARGFLPNDLKTEIVWSMNVRAARNVLKLRTAPAAHPDAQVVCREIHRLWYELVPVLFQDIQDKVEKLVEA